MRETVILEKDEEGNIIIPISNEVMEALHVKIGDDLGLEKMKDGTIRLFKC